MAPNAFMKFYFAIKICLFCFLLQSFSAVHAQTEPVISFEVPEGFDDLLEPQRTLVDIYYNGLMIGSSLANYSLELMSFENPREVFGLLSNLSQPAKVFNAFLLPLATNQSRVCFYQGQTNCGVLVPEVVGIIFDESQLRVDLFVNPLLLEQQALKVSKYLPPSTSGTSMINNISLIAAGGNELEDVYTARVNSILSFDNYRMIANVESDQQNDTRLDQLSFVYEERDLEYQLGTFRTLTNSSSFFHQRDFLGFRVQSSLASRTDLEQVSGTKIFVFLNERSQIEVYKDGQLIDSRIYQAGNIELDTRYFPQGSYNIELKIIGDSGQEKIETHFYSKSLALPPTGETLFFAEVGYPEDEKIESYPVAKDDALVRFGVVSRVSDSFGLSSSVVKNSQQETLELGSFWLGNQVELQTNHVVNADDEHAAYYLMNIRHPNFFVSASYRRTYTEDLSWLNNDLRLIAVNNRQTIVNLGIPFERSVLNFFSRTSQQPGFDDIEILGLSWRKNIYRSGRMHLDWTIDASKQKDDERLLVGLTLRFLNNKSRFESRVTREVRKTNQNTQQHWNKHSRLSYNNQHASIGQTSTSLAFNQTKESDRVSLNSELNNDYGHARMTFEHIKTNSLDNLVTNTILGANTSQNTYVLASRFNFVSSDGEVALGGSRHNNSGVMIDVKSINVDDLEFAVMVNDVERARLRAGTSSFVALPPYKSYRVSLVPKGKTLVQFDNTLRTFSLYPGNIKNLKWQIEQVSIVIMQLVGTNKQVFANAQLKIPKTYARSDDLGWLQLEIKGAGELIFQNAQGQECKIVITEQELTQTISFLGEKQCQ